MNKFLAGLLFFCSTSFAGSFQEGVDAYDKFDYTKAYQIWLPLANEGNSKAQYNLGIIFAQGDGQKADLKQAFAWFKKSADLKYTEAEYRLGNAYYFGKGVSQNYDQAINFWQKAAKKNQASAQYNLGVLYLYGGPQYRNVAKAKKWLKKSSQHEHQGASQLLATLPKEIVQSKPIVEAKNPEPGLKSKDKLAASQLSEKKIKEIPENTPEVSGLSLQLSKSMPEKSVAKIQKKTKTPEPEKDWVSKQNKKNYTVQLTVRTTMAQAEAFIKKHKLSGKAFAYKLKNKKMVKVIYGSYPKRSQASQAIRKLSQALRKDGPWTKKFILVRSERGF